MATCVFCNSPDNLNTSMTVALEDNAKTSVVICDTCADEATPKKVREAYIHKQEQIADVMAQARALGLDLTTQSPGQKIQVVQSITPPIAQPAQPASPSPLPANVSPLIEDEEGPVISTAHLLKPMRSVGGNAALGAIHANVPSHQSHDLGNLGSGVLSGKAKVTVVEGRGGVPLQLPALIQDGTGTTRLRVSQRMDDASLQRRFKSLGHESRWDRGADFRSGYEEDAERTCPICRGSGRTRNLGRDVACPKCSGTGIIIV